MSGVTDSKCWAYVLRDWDDISIYCTVSATNLLLRFFARRNWSQGIKINYFVHGNIAWLPPQNAIDRWCNILSGKNQSPLAPSEWAYTCRTYQARMVGLHGTKKYVIARGARIHLPMQFSRRPSERNRSGLPSAVWVDTHTHTHNVMRDYAGHHYQICTNFWHTALDLFVYEDFRCSKFVNSLRELYWRRGNSRPKCFRPRLQVVTTTLLLNTGQLILSNLNSIASWLHQPETVPEILQTLGICCLPYHKTPAHTMHNINHSININISIVGPPAKSNMNGECIL
jgi:hypothetical protein